VVTVLLPRRAPVSPGRIWLKRISLAQTVAIGGSFYHIFINQALQHLSNGLVSCTYLASDLLSGKRPIIMVG
jgi:hypothetical protein